MGAGSEARKPLKRDVTLKRSMKFEDLVRLNCLCDEAISQNSEADAEEAARRHALRVRLGRERFRTWVPPRMNVCGG